MGGQGDSLLADDGLAAEASGSDARSWKTGPVASSWSTPPRHLSAESKRWWKLLAEVYRFEPWQYRILRQAAEAFDRAEECRRIITEEGAVVRDRFDQPKPHPLLAEERSQRVVGLRAVRELALAGEDEKPEYGRPPRLTAVVGSPPR